MTPGVFLPMSMGCIFLVAGIFTYRRDLTAAASLTHSRLLSLGPVFIAGSLAAFAGEHFTAARSLAQLVPKWLPARVGIAYFVGVAHTAAALSLVARHCLRWSTLFLGIMFALFVLLLHFPGAIRNPGLRIAWIVTVRETTFSLGAFSLLAYEMKDRWPTSSALVAVARVWSAMVIIYFGIDQILHPAYTPGVPDTSPTPSWIPFPHALVYLTGILLIVFGIAMLIRKYATYGSKGAGLLMLLLTIFLFVPEFFLVHGVAERVTAINFIFDTLLFSGTMLAIGKGILAFESQPKAISQTAM
jgi:uncharacterized membrane protein